MKYRAEIDGLRALAVVPVILFHAGFDLFRGGFVGVDVFFVISGYLITTILIEDIEHQRFSIVHFYERRARRILPALFVVMLVCIPFAWMWMLPSEMTDFAQSLIAVVLFASNVLFWKESGYFEAAAEDKPLLHTWSLAVEEQYYLIFPIFLFFAWRFGRDRTFWMIVVLAAISLAISEWGWRNEPNANFYLAPTRAWELFAGSIAAFIVQKRGVQSNNLLALIGLAAILFATFVYDKNTPFPSVYTLVPVLGVVLLILYADARTLAAKILSMKVFVGIGLISYSAYLWHQPLLAFARLHLSDGSSIAIMSGLSIASLVLAFISWKYIEQPFRDKQRFTRRHVFSFSLVGGLFFAGLGTWGHFSEEAYETYWLGRQTADVQNSYELIQASSARISNFGVNPDGRQILSECRFNVRQLDSTSEAAIRECAAQYGQGVLILGDSHAIDLYGVVASRFETPFLIGVTRGSCRPHENYDFCHYDRVDRFLENNPDTFRRIIYEQAGFYLLQKPDGTEGHRDMFSRLSITTPVTDILPDLENINGTLDYLVKISAFAPVTWFAPRAEPHIPIRHILRQGCNGQYAFRDNQYEVFKDLDRTLMSIVDARPTGRVELVSQNDVFGFDLSTDFMDCTAWYWSDGDHLSSYGEERFGARLPPDFID